MSFGKTTCWQRKQLIPVFTRVLTHRRFPWTHRSRNQKTLFIESIFIRSNGLDSCCVHRTWNVGDADFKCDIFSKTEFFDQNTPFLNSPPFIVRFQTRSKFTKKIYVIFHESFTFFRKRNCYEKKIRFFLKCPTIHNCFCVSSIFHDLINNFYFYTNFTHFLENGFFRQKTFFIIFNHLSFF